MFDKGLIWVKRVCICMLGLILIFMFLYVILFHWNSFSLEIELEGDTELFVEYGETYVEPGLQVFFYGTVFFEDGVKVDVPVTIENEIIPGHLGRFNVHYSADFKDYHAETERIVWIVDTVEPTIELFSVPDEPIPFGSVYEEKGFRAMDNFDGDITHLVVRTEEDGIITYGVADSSGNPCYVQRFIEYIDLDYPELELIGEDRISINAGEIYVDPGCNAWDTTDGNLTEFVETVGEVLWYLPGKYVIQYTVSDSFGNITSKEREIEVLAAKSTVEVFPGEKTIYLTFDDGPSIHTLRLLDILDKYNVKATFFVVNSGHNYIMREIVRRGHSIGIHSMSHSYNDIYASPEAYFTDLYDMQSLIQTMTGVYTSLVRFPGGGSNTISCSNPGIMTVLTQAVQDAGFQYFDWNVDSNDAGGAKSKDTVLNNVIQGVKMNSISTVLQHDIHAYSVEAVEEIILWGIENGYQFLPLDSSSPAFHHDVRN